LCTIGWGTWTPICPAGEEFGWRSYFSKGRATIVKAVLDGKLPMNENLANLMYRCILCGGCAKQCQTNFGDKALDIYEKVREELVKAGIGPMPEHKKIGEHVKNEHNPYFEAHSNRLSWNQEALKLPSKAEVVYFVGCTPSYRQTNLARATVSILNKIGVDYTIMSDEWCCGSPLIRTGQTSLAKSLAEHNLKVIEKTGANTVITSCAGCYRTLKNDYPKFATYDFSVLHIVEFLDDLISDKKIEFIREYKKKVTYHDPCHLGRHCGVYEPPRHVLKAIPGLKLIEMKANRDNAFCCGAGAGVKSAVKDLAMNTVLRRLEMVEQTGAEVLASACPFCNRNFLDGVKVYKGKKPEVIDVVEIVDQTI
jgi:heterodisulfide reductase subunit D